MRDSGNRPSDVDSAGLRSLGDLHVLGLPDQISVIDQAQCPPFRARSFELHGSGTSSEVQIILDFKLFLVIRRDAAFIEISINSFRQRFGIRPMNIELQLTARVFVYFPLSSPVG